MPLTLSRHTPSAIPLEVDAVRLETVRTQSPDAVLRTPVQRGNKSIPLGDFFTAHGSAADDQTIVWQGDCSRVKRIGAALREGTIRIEGPAGLHLGVDMRGGEIHCEGDAGDWVGGEMRGGRITIRGNAGDHVGSVYPGGRAGMRGGEILIHGNVGDQAGCAMRRGLIAVGGASGNAVGSRMIAGTIVVTGRAGIRHGCGMKRGTLVYLTPGLPLEILPTFRLTGTFRPVFLQFYLRRLRSLGFPVDDADFARSFRRYSGDLLELGLGELLVAEGG